MPGKAQPVWSEGEIKVYSFAVEHADTPTLAFRIVTPKGDIVFMSDNNATAAGIDEFIKDANILVMHFPINEQDEESGQLFWHANPSKIGQVALKAQPQLLVLSHFMDLSLNDKSESLNKVQASYKGPIILANDLVKISLSSLPQEPHGHTGESAFPAQKCTLHRNYKGSHNPVWG